MNALSETKTATSMGADQQTFIVLGVLLQFLKRQASMWRQKF